MKFSFRIKILLLVVTLVCVSQIITFFTFSVTSSKTVNQQIEEELYAGAELFIKLLEQRNKQLLTSVEVLVSDFGFKEAATKQDTGTVQSVLINHGARIEADFAMLISLDGKVVSSTLDSLRNSYEFPFAELVNQASIQGNVTSTVIVDNQPYQVVAVPVNAPVRVAWAFMGFAVDDKLASTFKSLTGLEVSFWSSANNIAPRITTTIDNVSFATLSTETIANLTKNQRINTHSINDHNYLTLVKEISAVHGSTIAILHKSASESLAPYRSLWTDVSLFAVATLLISGLIGIAMSRSVTHPVKKLVQAAQHIEEGNYRHSIDVTRSDELGVLAAAFNTMQQNIAEREARIIHQAHHDALTGLPNRVLANDRLETAIDRAKRDNNSVAVLLMDLNRFKEINDTMGHHIGDMVLQEVSVRLVSRLRHSDTIARLGGDEFMVILEHTNLDQATKMAQELAMVLTDKFVVESTQLSVGVSIGIAGYAEHGETAETLLRRADIAMYDAKATNSASVVYQPGRDEGYFRQLSIIRDIKDAVANNQLQLHYQPKIDFKSKKITHVEALVRWVHPEHGYLPPDEFIPLAEQSGNIVLVTKWVLKNVIKQMADWMKQGVHISTAVNLSALDLLHDDLANDIEYYLHQYAVKPNMLSLEVTESALMHDITYSLKVLDRLKKIGLSISIDDFGTGYSSLAQLKRLPVDELKIDKSFVLDLKENDDGAVIIRSTIELGHNIGFRVVAEDVENHESWTLLKQFNCDMVQGYLISKPLPPDKLIEWLQEGSAEQSKLWNDTQEVLAV